MNFFSAPETLSPAAQRAHGRLALSFAPHGPTTRIQNFYQEGCLKARLPRPVERGICEAVLMNISGGIAGGDNLGLGITLAANAQAAIATSTAERIYRSLGPPSQIHTQITIGPNASLAYLPQETIFFNGFALNRTLTINLAASASYLGVESLIFGRQAMSETVTQGSLRDRIILIQNGKLTYQDSIRLNGNIHAQLQRQAVANGAIAMASLIYAAPDAPARLEPIRAALGNANAGATLMDGILIARILAPSAATLRNYVTAALRICRDGQALPRVWQS
jgi:urease accessory protein